MSRVYDEAFMSVRPSGADVAYDSPPRWRDDAACRDTDPEIFFPDHGKGFAAAARYCITCSVRTECLAFGLNERDGFWGGMSPEERRALRRQRDRRNSSTDRSHLAVVDEGAAVGHALRGVLAILAARL